MEPGGAGSSGRIDRYFGITERGSSVQTELRGGLATFFTMAYIVVLNPIILSSAADVNGARLDFAQVASSTALVAAVMTILMGVVGRYPFAIAAGLGLNTVVAFQLASQMSWPAAMGIVVIEGLAITLLVLTGFRQAVFEAVPLPLKHAISVGIGLFLAFIGFVDAGFVRRLPDAANTPVPVGMGIGGRLLGWPTLVFVVGTAARHRAGGPTDPGGDPHQHRGDDSVRGGPQRHRRRHRPDRARSAVQRPGLEPQRAVGARQDPGQPRLRPHRHFSLGGSFAEVGVISALLLVFTLMLADCSIPRRSRSPASPAPAVERGRLRRCSRPRPQSKP